MPDPLPSGSAASLFERGELPLPTGALSPGTAPVVAVAVTPGHPSNAVLIQTRRQSEPVQAVRAMPETAPREQAQWFRGVLPALERGRRLDYRVELVRAGQLLATLPADGSWLTVIGDLATPPSVQPGPTRSADTPSPTAAPRWAYDLEFFAALTITLRPEIVGESPEGYRINFLVETGRVVGPRIEAVVLREGGDYLCIRGDGIGILDVRTIYQTTDGALIFYRAGGRLDLGPDGYAKVLAGQFTGLPPFYATPTFITADPDWQWLNRLQAFGIGRVLMEERQVQYDIYIPQVGGRLSDA
jgi:hypothetical protein